MFKLLFSANVEKDTSLLDKILLTFKHLIYRTTKALENVFQTKYSFYATQYVISSIGNIYMAKL